ncbi:hypothetical protein H8356DRAFT_1361403 [Neocallimastix lanati (nom. inval.)]|nr:hypothetical protein H8356DRAFT_1361403 [Neocallimastix sp. JGI-2020a]
MTLCSIEKSVIDIKFNIITPLILGVSKTSHIIYGLYIPIYMMETFLNLFEYLLYIGYIGFYITYNYNPL